MRIALETLVKKENAWKDYQNALREAGFPIPMDKSKPIVKFQTERRRGTVLYSKRSRMIARGDILPRLYAIKE